MKKIRYLIFIIGLPAIFFTCSYQIINQSYSFYEKKNYLKAASVIDDKNITGVNQILFLLLKGSLLQYSKEYEKSNEYYLKAAKEWDNQIDISITDSSKSILINDYFQKYWGEYHEKIYSHLFSGLNFMMLNNIEASLVEIKKAFKINNDNSLNSKFLNFMYALSSDILQEKNDAVIEYNELLNNNFNDEFVIKRLYYNSLLLGNYDTVHQLKEKYSELLANKNSEEKYLILFLFSGRGPRKAETFIIIDNVKVSIPKYTSFKNQVSKANIILSNDTGFNITKSTEILDNVNNIAVDSLDKRLKSMLAKEAFRSYLKHQMMKKVENENKNNLLSNLFSLAITATEMADLRCWSTLPAYISVAAFAIPTSVTDSMNVDVTYLDENNVMSARQTVSDINLKNKFNFLFLVY